jgi:serine/threonine protein phosphatase 1
MYFCQKFGNHYFIGMSRTLVIGDIHGAYRALEQALKRAKANAGDTLIFLGDYVDGWSQSFEVVAYLRELKEKHTCFFIRGNHDAWCEDWLRKGSIPEAWLFNGGTATLESYQKASEQVKQEHLKFFTSLLNYYIDGNNNLFIHAGYSSQNGPEGEKFVSEYRWDRSLWETAVTMDSLVKKNPHVFPKRLQLFKEIFIGHTPTLNYGRNVPMHAVNVWNVDTGAAFHGPLTILDTETKKFWQSDAVKTLYPNEKGRN